MTAKQKSRGTDDARAATPDAKTPAGPAAETPAPPEPTVRLLAESHVDGFPTDEPEWVAYCPRCGMKLPFEEHKSCRHFEGEAHTPDGEPIAVRCAFPPGSKPKDD